jgi:hypothetical protein
VNMTKVRVPDSVRIKIAQFLGQNLTRNQIIKELAAQNIKISAYLVSTVKKEIEGIPIKRNGKSKSSPIGRPRKLSKSQQSRLRKFFLKDNPPTIKFLAGKFDVSKPTIRYYRDVIFKLKKLRKRRVHALDARSILQRRARSWWLYRLLIKKGWDKFITSDEKTFHLTTSSNQTDIYYVTDGENHVRKIKKKSGHKARGIMVWAAVSARGKSSLIFVDTKAKVNADYYVPNILKPFFKKDLPRLYPDHDYIFQQDSAPSKNTIAYLDRQRIRYLPPKNG